MPKKKQQPLRKTTDATIINEDWSPVSGWINTCHRLDPRHQPPYLFIHPDAEPGLELFMRRADRTPLHEDLKLRMPHQHMEGLARQLRFWESAMDELMPQLRNIAPPPAFFQIIAFELEIALAETKANEQHVPPRP